MMNKVSQEARRVVFDRIQSQTAQPDLGGEPRHPVKQISSDLWVVVVHIGEHPAW